MNNADRYQKEFDLMMQDLEAEANRRENLDRETAWKTMQKTFTAMANAHGWDDAKRERVKKKLLDELFS